MFSSALRTERTIGKNGAGLRQMGPRYYLSKSSSLYLARRRQESHTSAGITYRKIGHSAATPSTAQRVIKEIPHHTDSWSWFAAEMLDGPVSAGTSVVKCRVLPQSAVCKRMEEKTVNLQTTLTGQSLGTGKSSSERCGGGTEIVVRFETPNIPCLSKE